MKAKILALALALGAVLYLQFFVDFKKVIQLDGLTDEAASQSHDQAAATTP